MPVKNRSPYINYLGITRSNPLGAPPVQLLLRGLPYGRSSYTTVRAELIGLFEPCTTDIYLHIYAHMGDCIRTHPSQSWRCGETRVFCIPNQSSSWIRRPWARIPARTPTIYAHARSHKRADMGEQTRWTNISAAHAGNVRPTRSE